MQHAIEAGQLKGAIESLATEYRHAQNGKAEDFLDFDLNRLATYQQRGFLVGVRSKPGVGRSFTLAGAVQVLGMLELYFRGALPLAEAAAGLRTWTNPAGTTKDRSPLEPCYTFADEGTFLAILYGPDGNSSAHVLPAAALRGRKFDDPHGVVNSAVVDQMFTRHPTTIYCVSALLERAKEAFESA